VHITFIFTRYFLTTCFVFFSSLPEVKDGMFKGTLKTLIWYGNLTSFLAV